MLIVLSQKIDTESTYSDDLYKTYHYPKRYRNQIHKGDTFVYYQGNRYDKSQRYYFGMGKIGKITCEDEENYYADLLDCQKFEKKVPIYLPDGGYIESLGYETVRNSINPPWQSSIRPISRKALGYIKRNAGEIQPFESVDRLKDELKRSVQAFYVGGKEESALDILDIAQRLCRALGLKR